MIYKPFAAECLDRTKLAERNPIAGEPENWLTDDLLNEKLLKQINFDFFVNWSTNTISPQFWVKRLADHDEIQVTTDNLQSLIYQCDNEQFVKDLAWFVNGNLRYKIFRESSDWPSHLANEKSKPILDVTLDKFGKVTEVKKVELNSLMKEIRYLSGGPVKVGPKGLSISNTSLECFLSKTDALWPGDVDMILLSKKNEAVAMLEFKKHTLYAKMEKYSFERYYRESRSDQRKYNRLALFRDAITNNPPIIIIYYPTKEHISQIILEKIEGPVGNLITSKREYLDLPVNKDQKVKLIETILDMSKS